MKKKIIALVVCMTFLFSFTVMPQSFALSSSDNSKNLSDDSTVQKVKIGKKNYTIEVIRDTDTVREVKVVSGNESSTAIFHKDTESIEVLRDGQKIEADVPKVTPAPEGASYAKGKATPTPTPNILDKRSSFNDYYSYCNYTQSGKTWWCIKSRDNVKTVAPTSSNKTNLASFRSSVRTLMDKETVLLGTVSAATFSLLGTAIALSGPTLGISGVIALIGSLGIAASNVPVIISWYNTSKDCEYYYALI